MFQLDRTWPLLFPSSSSPSPFLPSCSQVFRKFCSQFFSFSVVEIWLSSLYFLFKKYALRFFVFRFKILLSGFYFLFWKLCSQGFIFHFESFAVRSFIFHFENFALLFFQLLLALKLCSRVFIFFFYLETKNFLLRLGLLLPT